MTEKSYLAEYEARNEALNRSSRRAAIIAAVFGITIVSGSILSRLFSPQEPSRLFEQQLARLDDTEAALKELTLFVTEQRQDLEQSERTLGAIKSDTARLDPLLKMKKAELHAVLEEFESRQPLGYWASHGVSFGLGLLSTLITTWIGRRWPQWVGRFRTPSAEPSPSPQSPAQP